MRNPLSGSTDLIKESKSIRYVGHMSAILSSQNKNIESVCAWFNLCICKYDLYLCMDRSLERYNIHDLSLTVSAFCSLRTLNFLPLFPEVIFSRNSSWNPSGYKHRLRTGTVNQAAAVLVRFFINQVACNCQSQTVKILNLHLLDFLTEYRSLPRLCLPNHHFHINLLNPCESHPRTKTSPFCRGSTRQ